jgi:hypothetical protein
LHIGNANGACCAVATDLASEGARSAITNVRYDGRYLIFDQQITSKTSDGGLLRQRYSFKIMESGGNLSGQWMGDSEILGGSVNNTVNSVFSAMDNMNKAAGLPPTPPAPATLTRGSGTLRGWQAPDDSGQPQPNSDAPHFR